MNVDVMAANYQEGQSIQRPPLFNGENYTYWKTRMRFFMQSLDYDLWECVSTPYVVPTVTQEDGTVAAKTRSTWTDDEKKKEQFNAKGVHILFCALDPNEFNRVSTCDTAHKILENVRMLEVTHERTNRVKRVQNQYAGA